MYVEQLRKVIQDSEMQATFQAGETGRSNRDQLQHKNDSLIRFYE